MSAKTGALSPPPPHAAWPDAFALIHVDPPRAEPVAGALALGHRLHALRGAAKLSLRPVAVSYDGAPLTAAIRVGRADAGAETWLGVAVGPGLTLDTLRQALRATASTLSPGADS